MNSGQRTTEEIALETITLWELDYHPVCDSIKPNKPTLVDRFKYVLDAERLRAEEAEKKLAKLECDLKVGAIPFNLLNSEAYLQIQAELLEAQKEIERLKTLIDTDEVGETSLITKLQSTITTQKEEIQKVKHQRWHAFKRLLKSSLSKERLLFLMDAIEKASIHV